MEIAKDEVEAFLSRMLEYNKRINLTNIDDINQARVFHIEDSLAAVNIFEKYCEGEYADLGSGCGFPGVAIALTTRHKVDLIDSSQKKMKVIDEIVKSMGVQDFVNTIPKRVEEVSIERFERYNILTSRAMTSLSSLLELASPLLQKTGHVIAYKSLDSKEEFESAKNVEEILGMKFRESITYKISDRQRMLYIYEKVSEPEIKLPRRIGLAQKRPLKK